MHRDNLGGKFPVYVFSYNRGRYLENCLASIRRHAPSWHITVIDDGSDDPAVHAALERYREHVDVISSRGQSDGYLGGLYPNMQHALACTDEPIVLFLQDDMQIVRDVTADDERHWQRYFDLHDKSFQLYACFFKRKQIQRGQRLVDIDSDVPAYFRNPEAGRRSWFSAVGLFQRERMLSSGWRFEPSEGENNRKVREWGWYMGVTPWPFMMWLPNAESSKFRRRGILQRIAEWRADVGLYPYRELSPEAHAWLMDRPLEELPVAESLLDPEGMKPGREWLFADATKAVKPLHRHLKRRKKKRVRQEQREHRDP